MNPTHCKYCGARLKRDPVGLYCPTKNCQWAFGIPDEEENPDRKIIFEILESQNIRLIDGRYQDGFVDTQVLREMIEKQEVNTVKIAGLTFVTTKNRH